MMDADYWAWRRGMEERAELREQIRDDVREERELENTRHAEVRVLKQWLADTGGQWMDLLQVETAAREEAAAATRRAEEAAAKARLVRELEAKMLAMLAERDGELVM